MESKPNNHDDDYSDFAAGIHLTLEDKSLPNDVESLTKMMSSSVLHQTITETVEIIPVPHGWANKTIHESIKCAQTKEHPFEIANLSMYQQDEDSGKSGSYCGYNSNYIPEEDDRPLNDLESETYGIVPDVDVSSQSTSSYKGFNISNYEP